MVNADTLTGDLRDALLTHMRAMETPWSKLSEAKQAEKIEAVTKMAESLVQEAVDAIAARGLPSLVIEVGKFTVDGAEMKGAFTCFASDENLLRIRHLSNARAVFVLASPDAFYGERSAAETDRDEPELPIGDAA